jgi:hypothetical protein
LAGYAQNRERSDARDRDIEQQQRAEAEILRPHEAVEARCGDIVRLDLPGIDGRQGFV